MSIPKITDDRKDLYRKVAVALLEQALAFQRGDMHIAEIKGATVLRLQFNGEVHYGITSESSEYKRGLINATTRLYEEYQSAVPDTVPDTNPQRMRRDILKTMVTAGAAAYDSIKQ